MNCRPLQVGMEFWLEGETTDDLHLSAADCGACDLFRRIVTNCVVAGLSEAGVVKDVCSFGTNLESNGPIRHDVETLAKREVNVGQIRAINLVPHEVAVLVGVVGGVLPGLRAD